MLDELRMAPPLHGVRGKPPVDREALARAIAGFSRRAVHCASLAEIEVNPLVAGPGGAVAVDARAPVWSEEPWASGRITASTRRPAAPR
jgi:hypothetical protein